MPRVGYTVEMQGFRPRTNPGGALAGLRGMGADNTFSGCVSAVNANGDPVSCSDPSAAVWFDSELNAAPPGTISVPNVSGVGGAPTGSLLLYQGQWQVTATLNINTIISRVAQAIRTYGLQVVNSQNSGGALTLTSFNVVFVLQVTGSGFAQPVDAGSIVDHAYYSVTGRMPVFSSTVLQSAPGSSVPTLPTNPSGSSSGQPSGSPPATITSWIESHAAWIGVGLLAAIALPPLLKKL